MASLSTHVLDTARGIPAAGVIVDLHHLHNGEREHVRTSATNPDGRTSELLGSDLEPGTYEITFHVGEYFRANRAAVADPPFLDLVTVRFGMAEVNGHYHVPLLVSPYGYSTYRGS
jgi:5-hydroxyisourate hydrolase